MRASNDAVADLVPVDVVINNTIAAAWYSGKQTCRLAARRCRHVNVLASFKVGLICFSLHFSGKENILFCSAGLKTSQCTTAQLVGSTLFTGEKLV